MTNSFKSEARRFVLPLQFSTGPSKLFKFPEIVRPPPSLGGLLLLSRSLYACPDIHVRACMHAVCLSVGLFVSVLLRLCCVCVASALFLCVYVLCLCVNQDRGNTRHQSEGC
jgi:hypothetical protein